MAHVALYGVSESIAEGAIDLIYGKEPIISPKDRNRFIHFLQQIGVNWSEEDQDMEPHSSVLSSSSTNSAIEKENEKKSERDYQMMIFIPS